MKRLEGSKLHTIFITLNWSKEIEKVNDDGALDTRNVALFLSDDFHVS